MTLFGKMNFIFKSWNTNLSSSEEIFTGSFRIRRIVQDRNKESAYLWLWTERNAALHD